jgi:hypothetical protein
MVGSQESKGKVIFNERFAWRNARVPSIADQTPGVIAVWQPMGVLCVDVSVVAVEPVSTPFDKT